MILTPCLTLCAPSGMTKDDRKVWLAAAFEVLGDIPLQYLKRGAEAARRSADHPSKIVPIINREARGPWVDDQRAEQIHTERMRAIEQQREDIARLPDYGASRETTADILARAWPTMAQHEPGYRAGKLNLDPDRECRKPTRADYLRMGVMPDALDAMGLVAAAENATPDEGETA